MFLNMAFYYGFQWTIYNLLTAELQEVDNPAGLIRITSNQIQPRMRNLHAKMTKSRPQVDAIPDNWSEKSVRAASLSRKLMEQWKVDHDEDQLDSETVDWTLICGNSWRKVGFDPTEGEQRSIDMEKFQEYAGLDPETGLAQQSEYFAPNEDQTQVDFNVGEIFDEVVPPFELYFPEYASTMANTQELLQVKLMPLQEVRDKWGLRKTKDVAPTKDIHLGNYFQTRLLGMANPEVGTATGISQALLRGEDIVYVKEHWIKPSKRYPKGQLRIVAGEDARGTLYAESNPYYDAWQPDGILKEQGYIPFIKFAAINAPGRIWDISPVEAMRPLQAEYNKCISEIVQNRITVGRNKIIAPKTANIDEEEVANIHGQFLQFSGIIPPQIFPAQPLPIQTEREIERNSKDLDTISGSHEVSRAQVPSGVKSGIAINYLLEQDDTTLGPIIANYERAQTKLKRAKLGLAKYYYLEDRLIKDANTDDPMEVLSFKGSDLTTNLRLVPGSALPQSRAALQAIYMDLYERGAIIDEATGMPDPKKLMRMLKDTMPVESFFEAENLDESRATRENLMLSRGQFMEPKHWEDHKVHVEAHNRFRKSETFYKLVEQDQQISQMFDYHITFHIQFLAPPTDSGFESALGGMPGPGSGSGQSGQPSRISPGMMGSGSGGALNNPPSNRGQTFGGSMGGR